MAGPLEPGAKELYERAIVIDSLGGIGGPSFSDDRDTSKGLLIPEELAAVRASGVTAVNLTLSRPTFDATMRNLDAWRAEIAKHPDYLTQALRPEDILAAKQAGKLAVIIGYQGLDMIENDMARIDASYDAGVRIMQLSYNKHNLLAAGSLDPISKGLTPFGRDVVARINQLGATVDVSHGNMRVAIDTAAASKKPIAITHTGARAIYDHPRNLPDEALTAVTRRGGVVGIYLVPFLGLDPIDATRRILVRHLDHALKICGEDHVGIGTDVDTMPIDYTPEYLKALEKFGVQRRKEGIATPLETGRLMGVPELNFPRKLQYIASDLLKAGYSSRVVEKVLGGNFLRLFQETWT
ncbi:membrane dipeptidase [Sphingosinicella sp. GR2756]|uniref:Membrane dipeptidase n=1 Tax=Sphingosinicella rhizophila TaxID=3050082 RepID=A0ABU3Q2K5_9SPHN|nr:membrane dipeptidase [Sphingosinicella sp. GR2756]